MQTNATSHRDDVDMSVSTSSKQDIEADTTNVDDIDTETMDDSNQTISPDEAISLGLLCKNAGNELLKSNLLEETRDKYLEGLRHVEHLDPSIVGLNDLLKPLHMNLSLVYMKLCKWREAEESATQAITIDPNNVKAVYRRGAARAQLGELNDAKKDLYHAHKLDMASGEIRRELTSVTRRIAEENALRKQAYGSIFSRGNGNLYADKEEEQLKRIADQKAKDETQRTEWTIAMAQRKEKSEPELTFDDWLVQRDTEKSENNQKNDRTPLPIATSTDVKVKKKKPEVEKIEVDESDEEDRRVIAETKRKGYCYFNRELTQEEKVQRESHKPARLHTDDGNTQQANSSSVNGADNASGGAAITNRSLSSWNTGGTTWEEKDMTNWAKDALKARLLKIMIKNEPLNDQTDFAPCLEKLKGLLDSFKKSESSGLPAMNSIAELGAELVPIQGKVTKVVSLDGDASVAVVRGTRRYLFDFTVNLKWKIEVHDMLEQFTPSNDSAKKKSYTGEYYFADISSTNLSGKHWSDCGAITYCEKIEAAHDAAVKAMLKKLKDQCTKEVALFEEDFRKRV